MNFYFNENQVNKKGKSTLLVPLGTGIALFLYEQYTDHAFKVKQQDHAALLQWINEKIQKQANKNLKSKFFWENLFVPFHLYKQRAEQFIQRMASTSTTAQAAPLTTKTIDENKVDLFF